MKKNKKETRIVIKFYFFFAIVLAVAVLTPHVVRGHVFIPKQYSQSVVLLLDFMVAYFFYIFYKIDMKKLNKEKETIKKDKVIIENHLLDSYAHIGKSNSKMDLMEKFINFMPSKIRGEKIEEKEILNAFLENIIVSVAKVDKGAIRFVGKKDGRTISEYFYNNQKDKFLLRLSNAEIMKGKIKNNELSIIGSDYINTNTACVLYFPKNKVLTKTNEKLLKVMINQVHLLFLVIRSRDAN